MLPRTIVYFTIATVPILFGAVQPWVWSFYTALLFLAFLFILWSTDYTDLHRLKGSGLVLLMTVGVFFAITLIQCIPLPSPLSSFQSLYARSAALAGYSPTWQNLGYLPSPSLARWAFLFGLVFFPLAFRYAFRSRKGLRTLISIVLVVALIESFYGIVQALVPKMRVLWSSTFAYAGYARGTFINRNHFAGFVEMVWPIALGFTMAYASRRHEKTKFRDMISSDRTNKQILLVLLIVVLLLGLLFSASRAGIMGGFLGFLCFTALSRSKDKKLPLGFWLISGVVFLLLLVYGFKIGFQPIIDRFLLLETQGNSRSGFWRDGLVILQDHPLGIGLGNFKHVFPVYMSSVTSDIKVSHIHNDYLQFLIEAGWPAFIALMSGFVIFLVKSIRKVKLMKPRRDPLRFYLAVGALSGIISLAFHSFFDFNLQIPANCVYFVMLISIVYTCLWQTRNEKGKRQKTNQPRTHTDETWT